MSGVGSKFVLLSHSQTHVLVKKSCRILSIVLGLASCRETPPERNKITAKRSALANQSRSNLFKKSRANQVSRKIVNAIPLPNCKSFVTVLKQLKNCLFN